MQEVDGREQDPAMGGAAELDMESRLTDEHHQSLRLWLRMLSCTTRIENEIRSRLRTTFDITLPRFDLMAQLQRHPDGLRMGELSKRMMVTGGNITGITDQLEREQLVVRVQDVNDRRASAVKLTSAGRAAFDEMAAVHERWIEEMLADVAAEDKATMIALLSTMKRSLRVDDGV
ncbi:MarR family winged helix-turn-helix transcriptional regulator [Massilia aurea]|jgi:DNA-binding MarR family transcriptional regulator|uniref:MarR family winged helix-turn-helix transcriptional regulator n=1 Tax=Massilia aurea TaxID=373040 RepID=UPI0019A6089F|nr:MarR family transcriptional regulator [Massilia aurea]MBD8654527.1 MarR family transcriptional regulator [Oxalobacteraceae sp. CFBP 13730]MCS0707727.1 MarR family transcriptional regulator [Massilia aurea]